jgi:cold shock CspA family protein
MTTFTGCVKWFNNNLNYGFITVLTDGEHKNNDIFVHQSNIKTARDCFRTLYTGECVQFDMTKSDNAAHPIHAVNVTGFSGGMLHCENPNYHLQNNRGGRGGRGGRGNSSGRGRGGFGGRGGNIGGQWRNEKVNNDKSINNIITETTGAASATENTSVAENVVNQPAVEVVHVEAAPVDNVPVVTTETETKPTRGRGRGRKVETA